MSKDGHGPVSDDLPNGENYSTQKTRFRAVNGQISNLKVKKDTGRPADSSSESAMA
jgi:hypothetical protein